MNSNSISEHIHCHCSRQGPLVANDIFIALQEKKINSNLKTIYGVTQPNGLVSKYIRYRLSGLSKNQIQKILNQTKLGREENQRFNIEILSSFAKDIVITKDNLIEYFLIPLLDGNISIPEISRDIKENLMQYIENKLIGKDILSLEEGLILLSENLSNYFLQDKDVSIKVLYNLGSDYYNLFGKHIPLTTESISNHGILYHQNTNNNLIGELNKALKGYNTTNITNLSKAIVRLTRNTNSVLYQVYNSGLIEDISLNANNQVEINNATLPMVQDEIIRFYEKNLSPKTGDSEGENIYVSGLDMLGLMFNFAEKNNITSIKQQHFMRKSEGVYEKYKELNHKHKNVYGDFSDITIRDGNFKDFDKNIIYGIKYL